MQAVPSEIWWAIGLGTVVLVATVAVIVVTVISGQRRYLAAEEEKIASLRESEKKYRTLFENSLVGIFRFDVNANDFIDVNRAFLAMFHSPSLEKFRASVFGEHKIEWDGLWERLSRFRTIESQELVVTKADGLAMWITCSASFLSGEDVVEGAIADITEQKTAQEKIRDQAELLDKSSDAIVELNLDAQILYWNKGAQHLFGWSAEEIRGQSLEKLLFASEVRQDFRHGLTELKSKGEWRKELRVVGRTGGEQYADCRMTLVRDNRGQPKSILCINTDITQRKQLEAQMLRAQRLESIGTLAGGIAHDLNNILAPIVVSIDILKRSVGNALASKTLAAIETSAKRGTDMVKQVLTFARGIQGERVLIQLEHVLTEVRRLIEETFPKDIVIRNEIPKNLWTIEGDATQLHQVMMNLCVNSRDAMPSGGVLVLHAENTVVDEVLASKFYGSATGPHVHLWVSDTGMGIPEDLREKIFEPFFTTKPTGKGTGLGLSTTLGIVKNHNGFVHLDTEVGKGTTFHIYLPATLDEERDADVGVTREIRRANGELVLVVDDESVLREVATSTLESWGYTVLTAEDGQQAVEIFEERGSEIKAVITDMMMPRKDGAETIRALRQLDAGVKIIIMTGMRVPDDFRVEDIQAVDGVLQKPYTAERLLSTLQDVLEIERT